MTAHKPRPQWRSYRWKPLAGLPWHMSALLLVLLLPGPGTAGEPQVSAHPQAIDFGKPAAVTLHKPAGFVRAQLTLTPGGPALRRSITLRHQPHALSTAGDLLLVAGEGGLMIFDARAGNNEPLGRFAVDDTCTHVQAAPPRVLLACRQKGLLRIDISHPAAPRRTGHVAMASIDDLALDGDSAYVLVDHHAVAVIDTGDLRETARHTVAGRALAIAAGDRSLFLARDDDTLVWLRMSEALRFQEVDVYHARARIDTVRAAGSRVYLGLRDTGLVILDSADRHLQWLGSHHRLGQARSLQAFPGRVYAVTRDNVVMAVDVTDPRQPGIAGYKRLDQSIRGLSGTRRDTVWAITNTALHGIDFSAAAAQLSNDTFDVGEGVNFGGIRRGVIKDGIAYVADWFSGIHLFDVSDPQRPRLLSSFHTDGSPKGIVVRDAKAYVADDDHGLQVIDVTDPGAPKRIAGLKTPGLAYTPVLAGDHLYLASHRGGFQVIDVDEPAEPRLLASFDTPGKAWSIRVRNNIAYVADDTSGLMIFDVSDPAHIRHLATFDPRGAAEEVVLQEDYAYVAFFDKGLFVLDISDPRHPRELARLETPGNARGLELRGDRLYIADWLAGVHVVDIDDPRRPRISGSYDTDGAAWGVRVADQHAYVFDWWGGFTVLDIAAPKRPRLAGRYHGRGRVHDVAVDGGFAFAAYGEAGLQVFDIANPLNPTWVTGLDLNGSADTVWLHDGHAFIAGAGHGLTVADITNPFQVTTTASLPMGPASLMLGDDRGYLYLRDRDAGVIVVDVREARQPRRRALIGTRGRALCLMDNTLYIATARHSVQGYDVSDPSQPRPRQMYTGRERINGLACDSGTLFTAGEGGDIDAVQFSGGEGTRAGSLTVGEPLADLTLHDQQLFAATASGIWQIAADRPDHMQAVARYPLMHPGSGVTVDDDTAFVAGGINPTAVALFPELAYDDRGATVRLTFASGLAPGSYSVLLTSADGQRYITPNALTVRMPQPGQPAFSLEEYKKKLKTIREKQ